VNDLANVQPVLKVELNPNNPVPEICAIILAVMPYHIGQEEAVLLGIQEAISQRLEYLKGVVPDGEK
jgi:hypothetical protein